MSDVHPEPPGPGQESVWDYPEAPVLQANTRELTVVFGGVVVAHTTGGFRVLERGVAPVFYFPPGDVRDGTLVAAEYTTTCPHKGTAQYFDVHGGGGSASQSAWSYLTPSPGFEAIAKHVAFYAGPMDRCEVDGEVVTPQPGGFLGGWITSQVVGPFRGQQGIR
ncbi:MAG: DUF427 domain-containing protein [Thermoleophilia bacterium]